eukprot:m51a1_g13175 hypothetical protein (273) ;mRNA; f:94834-96147
MEIKAEITAPVQALLDASRPNSLSAEYALRSGTALSLVTDNSQNPSFLLTTIDTKGMVSRSGFAMRPIFITATDMDAAVRALPQGHLFLGALTESQVEAVLRLRPDAVDPRPTGGFVLMTRSLDDVPAASAELQGGARVRRLTREDAAIIYASQPAESNLSQSWVEWLVGESQSAWGVETPSGELAAWMISSPFMSALALGCTREQHRRKGYMRAVLRQILGDLKASGEKVSFVFLPKKSSAGAVEFGEAEGFTRAEGPRYWIVTQGSTTSA